MATLTRRQTVWLGIAVTAWVLALMGALTGTLTVLLLVLAGSLFAILLNRLATALQSHTPMGYHSSFGVIVLCLLTLIVLGFYYLGSQVVRRADEFASKFQAAYSQVKRELQQTEIVSWLFPQAKSMQEAMETSQTQLMPTLFSGLQSLGWVVTGGLVIFFVGLYAAFDPSLYRSGILRLVPPPQRPRAEVVLDQLHRALQQWISGRLMSMACVGILTWLGLWLIGVPLPISLGVIAALLTFIPNIGPVLAALPQIILATNVGINAIVYVIILNLALQTVESYMITPMIQRREVTLPPILTIAAQLVMGMVVGLTGVMMAAPLVVIAMVLTQMLYIHDRLGDTYPGQLAGDAPDTAARPANENADAGDTAPLQGDGPDHGNGSAESNGPAHTGHPHEARL